MYSIQLSTVNIYEIQKSGVAETVASLEFFLINTSGNLFLLFSRKYRGGKREKDCADSIRRLCQRVKNSSRITRNGF